MRYYNEDLDTTFRRVQAYIDYGYSWHYSVSKAGIKKHRLRLLLLTCPELKRIHDAYYLKRNSNLKWP